MSTGPTLRERLRWDAGRGEIRDGEVRYLMIRADSLMGLFAGLDEGARARALEALRASVRTHGARSAARYQRMGARQSEALREVIERSAGELGWGRWRLRHAPGGRWSLEVEGSPFADGYGEAGHPVCAPIVGMLEAIATLTGDPAAHAAEIECAATGAPACRFETSTPGG